MSDLNSNNKTEKNTEPISVQKSMLFNTVGSLIYYACQWAMSVVIVHISGYAAAGVLALAMTVTASPAIISLFNIRSYQVSDVKGQYSTKSYIHSRSITNLLAYIVCAIMILCYGYSWDKAGVILFFMLFKVAEGYADVYYGIEQRCGRLDYTGISLTIRGIGTIGIFVAIQLLFDNLLLSMVLITAFSFLVIFLFDRTIVRKLESRSEIKTAFGGFKEIWKLLLTCLPLAIVAYLNNLSFNLPKIALENAFGSEVMGYYSSVASPTMVVQLAATTIFAPLIPPLTEHFLNRDKKAFDQIMKKLGILFVILTLVCLIASKLLAHWGLTLLFGDSIEDYVYMFVPIIGITILLAVNACLFSLCTLIREIKSQYIIGAAGIAVSALLSYLIVPKFSMMGVVYAQFGAISIQIIIQVIIILRRLKKTWGGKNE